MIPEYVLDKALVDELEKQLAVADLLNWLDGEADQLAQLGFREDQGVQFSAELLRARNIEELRAGTTVIGEHASIEVGTRGYVIRHRDDLPRDRIKFSLAHEIGHTYWFDAQNLGQPISSMQCNASGAATIEHLCDFFAGALLLPRRQMEAIAGEFATSEIPPLHLISLLANEFQVADQAVARRLFFQILPRKVAIVKLKKGRISFRSPAARDEWRLSWCAVPRDLRSAHSITGLRAPFLTSSRVIPDDMIPNPVGDWTERCTIDGRWWEGLVAQSKKESRVSFRSRPPKRGADAFVLVSRSSDNLSLFEESNAVECMYMVLPLG